MSLNTEINETTEMQLNIQNELDMEEIRQLHNATLNFGKQCTEIKKLYVTVMVGVTTLFFNIFKENTLPISKNQLILLFILAISVLFYFLDVSSYFYQKKLRKKMIEVEQKIKNRYAIENAPTNESSKKKSILKIFFNLSMLIYYIVFVISLVLFFLL